MFIRALPGGAPADEPQQTTAFQTEAQQQAPGVLGAAQKSWLGGPVGVGQLPGMGRPPIQAAPPVVDQLGWVRSGTGTGLQTATSLDGEVQMCQNALDVLGAQLFECQSAAACLHQQLAGLPPAAFLFSPEVAAAGAQLNLLLAQGSALDFQHQSAASNLKGLEARRSEIWSLSCSEPAPATWTEAGSQTLPEPKRLLKETYGSARKDAPEGFPEGCWMTVHRPFECGGFRVNRLFLPDAFLPSDLRKRVDHFVDGVLVARFGSTGQVYFTLEHPTDRFEVQGVYNRGRFDITADAGRRVVRRLPTATLALDGARAFVALDCEKGEARVAPGSAPEAALPYSALLQDKRCPMTVHRAHRELEAVSTPIHIHEQEFDWKFTKFDESGKPETIAWLSKAELRKALGWPKPSFLD